MTDVVIHNNSVSVMISQPGNVESVVLSRGPAGPKGDVGPQGLQGPVGPQGPVGKDGTGVTILGSYATVADLQAAHPTGNPGDSYMVQGDLYVWDATNLVWKDVGQIQGPQGPAGPTGPQGPTGAQGPQGIQGVKGDTGATGPTGPQGATGPQGPQGDVGPAGPANTLAVGTVSSVPNGTAPSVSITGTAPNQTASFVLEAGPTGPQGPKGDPGTGSVNSVNGDLGPNVVLSINGYTTDTINLDAADVGAAPTVHTHTEADVTGLTTDLASKVPSTRTVAGHTLSADVTLAKADVGLGNVDNTSDLAKPISTATQTALNGKVDTTTTVNGHALSANVIVTKGDVGLGSVPNADATNASNISSGTLAQARMAPNVQRVYYGSGAVPARPTGATYVEWVGSTQPTGAAAGDTWVSTA